MLIQCMYAVACFHELPTHSIRHSPMPALVVSVLQPPVFSCQVSLQAMRPRAS